MTNTLNILDRPRGLAVTNSVSPRQYLWISLTLHSYVRTLVTPITIDKVRVIDLRFPTSREHIGSDAVNKDPDYSAAYCILETNSGLSGHGLTFTLGRGTDLVVSALKYLAVNVESRTLDSITSDLKAFYLQVTSDTQFRWLGPEKGVIHLACAALLNAVWDLYAKAEGKPVWRLLADMTPEQIVSIIDFRYIADALSPDEALAILRRAQSGKDARLVQLERTGYPAYTTSAGWFGYSEDKIRRLCHEGLAEGWTHFKLKVGGDSEDDLHRGRIMRDAIGPHNHMMVDANQKWGVSEAIARTRQLAELQPWWMEEPTSPDDVLGHARIRREAAATRIATGNTVTTVSCSSNSFRPELSMFARSIAAESPASTKTSPSY